MLEHDIMVENLETKVIVMVVAFLLIGITYPIAMSQVTATNTTSWGTAVTTIYTVLLPILVLIGCAITFVPTGTGKKR